MGAVSRAVTAVKMQSKGQGTFLGSVKQSRSVQGLMSIQQLLVIKRHGTCAVNQWSMGQGQKFAMVKRSRPYLGSQKC